MSIFNPAHLPSASTGFSLHTWYQSRIRRRSQTNPALVMARRLALMPPTMPHQRVTHSSPVYFLKMVSLRRQESCAKTCSSLVLQALICSELRHLAPLS
ncbi:hypothetical protein CY34DRAFT_805625 [Suillus luteus UH-Slu-Lm8-n1]|uniref:Uncharacterized protein n=1 Tax=Suillus luteus UH-Slu-Lm8-n1 TaxID=930992 RepID=A0A0D0B5Q5_9AGAM|nr:hypothetical protein CY34DRAFT_805625 [Suillus luteus UH-Slu-Lm8-n1]